MASDDAAAFLAACLVVANEVENGPDTMTSMAVGKSGVYPGADKAGKTRASAGHAAVPNHRPSDLPMKYFPLIRGRRAKLARRGRA